jgi:hypothetical protein
MSYWIGTRYSLDLEFLYARSPNPTGKNQSNHLGLLFGLPHRRPVGIIVPQCLLFLLDHG